MLGGSSDLTGGERRHGSTSERHQRHQRVMGNSSVAHMVDSDGQKVASGGSTAAARFCTPVVKQRHKRPG